MTFVICTPMFESGKPWFIRSLTETIRAFPDAPWEYLDHCYIDYAREQLAEIAAQYSPEGILWVDADMSWEVEDVKKVVGSKNIVCGIYPARKEQVAINDGFGFVWTPMACFDGPKPWFHTVVVHDMSYHRMGEDKYFFRLMHERGIQIDLYRSKTIGHAYEPGFRTLDDLEGK